MEDILNQGLLSSAPVEWLTAFESIYGDLMQIESRLGTPHEAPGDLDKARRIAHDLNNLLTSMTLRMQLDGVNLSQPMATLSAEVESLYVRLAENLSQCPCDEPKPTCPVAHLRFAAPDERLEWIRKLTLREVRGIMDEHRHCMKVFQKTGSPPPCGS